MKKATTPGRNLLRWQFTHPQPKQTAKKEKLVKNHTHIKNLAKVTDSK